MSELHTIEDEPREEGSIVELRDAIDEIIDCDDDPSPELVEKFNTAVTHVATEHDLDGSQVAHIVDTLRLEER